MQVPAHSLGSLASVFAMAAFLALPLSFLSVLLFTMIGHALHKMGHTQSVATGMLTAFNTLGAATGSLLTGLYLISKLGIEKCFLALIVGRGAASG